ncbi:vitellogenin-1-like [Schistocerca piceifrons]|uniref:vitellogenin-1-like n=1 Tax=Schistocerca piceifrons TaxID=274613 RepID=UPI001F5F577A|nr:vitellogenin-1-like [Schistocerca piceifrons]
MRLSAGSDGALSLVLPQHGLHLRFRNATLLVSASMGTRGRLCGICGNNDGEYVGDLTNPRGNQEKTATSFAASYKL